MPLYPRYKAMWLFALFDLPVETRQDRENYIAFRKALLNDGFFMVQYSVYARFCESEATAKHHRSKIRNLLPPDGEVRLLAVTDRQFSNMEVFFAKRRIKTETQPEQLLLF